MHLHTPTCAVGVTVHLILARGGEGFSQSCPHCHYPARLSRQAQTGRQGSVQVLAMFSGAHRAGGSSVRGHGWVRQADPVGLRYNTGHGAPRLPVPAMGFPFPHCGPFRGHLLAWPSDPGAG